MSQYFAKFISNIKAKLRADELDEEEHSQLISIVENAPKTSWGYLKEGERKKKTKNIKINTIDMKNYK